MISGIRPPVPVERSEAARAVATRMIAALEADSTRLFEFDGVDLAPAVEQMLFLAIRLMPRESGRASRGGAMGQLARVAYLRTLQYVHGRPAALRGRVAAITTSSAHQEILRPIEAKLAEPPSLSVVRLWDGPLRSATVAIPAVSAYLPLGGLRQVVRKYRNLRSDLRNVGDQWKGIADGASIGLAAVVLRRELYRATLDVACLAAIARQGPALLLTFDEIGRRARLVGPVAARHGVPSLDLPHAEATDTSAIRGAAYDMFGVFGPRSHAVLQLAGIAPRRIRAIGPARFDALIRREPAPPATPRRLVFASQWLGGQMTPAVKRETILIALQAAAAAAPCEFIVAPHPLERDGIADEVLAAGAPTGVTAAVERSRTLYELLDGAWALLTGWSNSVFEALLADVPPICILVTPGEPPTAFVGEGLALGATSTDEARAAIASLQDADARRLMLMGAKAALSQHIGPLDGRASDRAAALIRDMVASSASSADSTPPTRRS